MGWNKEEVFHPEGGDAVEQVAQGGCGCPIPGGIQGQAGCGSGQPGLLVGDPAHSRGLKLGDLWGPLLKPRPFCDNVGISTCDMTVPSGSNLLMHPRTLRGGHLPAPLHLKTAFYSSFVITAPRLVSVAGSFPDVPDPLEWMLGNTHLNPSCKQSIHLRSVLFWEVCLVHSQSVNSCSHCWLVAISCNILETRSIP